MEETGQDVKKKRKSGSGLARVVSPYFQKPPPSDVKKTFKLSEGIDELKLKKKSCHFTFSDNGELSSSPKMRKSGSGLTRVVSPYFQKPLTAEEIYHPIEEQEEECDGGFKRRIVGDEAYGSLEDMLSQFAYNPPVPVRGHLKEEIRKVSPYFQTSKSKTEVKPCRKKVKLSPYFQNVAKAPKKPRKKSIVLSTSQKLDDAYLRKTPDNTWTPPYSGFSVPLLQEDHAHDPWRVLVICILLNVTTGLQASKVITNFFTLCPDAKTAIEVPAEQIENVIQTLGLQKQRAKVIQRLSSEYLYDEWTHVTQLHGIGKYAADAYAIFCTGKWQQVHPEDHKLNEYWNWLMTTKTTC